MDKSSLGDRMKKYEELYCQKLMPRLPVYARLDGRCFSKFTQGFKRPYDSNMVMVMRSVTIYLMEEFHCNLGYTQSDEISLVWLNDSLKGEFLFDSKTSKLNSTLASTASVKFCVAGLEFWPGKCRHQIPTFDCRIMSMPDLNECANAIVWREMDATRNSIVTLSRSLYSNKELQNRSCDDMQDMIHDKGDNWNDYPDYFKKGSFYGRKPVEINTRNGSATRNKIVELEIPPLTKIENKVGVLFHNEEVIYKK